MIPSITALHKHWQRSCWVRRIWKQSTQNTIIYPTLRENGWKVDSNSLAVDWDSEENLIQVRTRVMLIKKGCGCKTGCTTGRCKFKKAGNVCGPGCKCVGCHNVPVPHQNKELSELDDEVEESDDSDDDLNEEVDEIMCEVFGTYGDEAWLSDETEYDDETDSEDEEY